MVQFQIRGRNTAYLHSTLRQLRKIYSHDEFIHIELESDRYWLFRDGVYVIDFGDDTKKGELIQKVNQFVKKAGKEPNQKSKLIVFEKLSKVYKKEPKCVKVQKHKQNASRNLLLKIDTEKLLKSLTEKKLRTKIDLSTKKLDTTESNDKQKQQKREQIYESPSSSDSGQTYSSHVQEELLSVVKYSFNSHFVSLLSMSNKEADVQLDTVPQKAQRSQIIFIDHERPPKKIDRSEVQQSEDQESCALRREKARQETLRQDYVIIDKFIIRTLLPPVPRYYRSNSCTVRPKFTEDIQMPLYPQEDKLSCNGDLIRMKEEAFDKEFDAGFKFEETSPALSNFVSKYGMAVFRKRIEQSSFQALRFRKLQESLFYLRAYRCGHVLDIIESLSVKLHCYVVRLYFSAISYKMKVDDKVHQDNLKLNSYQLQVWPFLVQKSLIKLCSGSLQDLAAPLQGLSHVTLLHALSGGVVYSMSLKKINRREVLRASIDSGFMVLLVGKNSLYNLLNIEEYVSPLREWTIYSLKNQKTSIRMKEQQAQQFFQEAIFVYANQKFIRKSLISNGVQSTRFVIHLKHTKQISLMFLQLFIQNPAIKPTLSLYHKEKGNWELKKSVTKSLHVVLPFRPNADKWMVVGHLGNVEERKAGLFTEAGDNEPISRESVIVGVYADGEVGMRGEWVDEQGEGVHYEFYAQAGRKVRWMDARS